MKKIVLTLIALTCFTPHSFALREGNQITPLGAEVTKKPVLTGKPIMRRFIGTPEQRADCKAKGGTWTAARGCVMASEKKPDLTTQKGCDDIKGIWDERTSKCGLRL